MDETQIFDSWLTHVVDDWRHAVTAPADLAVYIKRRARSDRAAGIITAECLKPLGGIRSRSTPHRVDWLERREVTQEVVRLGDVLTVRYRIGGGIDPAGHRRQDLPVIMASEVPADRVGRLALAASVTGDPLAQGLLKPRTLALANDLAELVAPHERCRRPFVSAAAVRRLVGHSDRTRAFLAAVAPRTTLLNGLRGDPADYDRAVALEAALGLTDSGERDRFDLEVEAAGGAHVVRSSRHEALFSAGVFVIDPPSFDLQAGWFTVSDADAAHNAVAAGSAYGEDETWTTLAEDTVRARHGLAIGDDEWDADAHYSEIEDTWNALLEEQGRRDLANSPACLSADGRYVLFLNPEHGGTEVWTTAPADPTIGLRFTLDEFLGTEMDVDAAVERAVKHAVYGCPFPGLTAENALNREGPPVWKLRRLLAAEDGETVSVTGQGKGPFAVVRWRSNDGPTGARVVHLATGLHIGPPFREPEMARAVVDDLLRAPTDWHQIRLANLYSEAVSPLVADMTAAVEVAHAATVQADRERVVAERTRARRRAQTADPFTTAAFSTGGELFADPPQPSRPDTVRIPEIPVFDLDDMIELRNRYPEDSWWYYEPLQEAATEQFNCWHDVHQAEQEVIDRENLPAQYPPSTERVFDYMVEMTRYDRQGREISVWDETLEEVTDEFIRDGVSAMPNEYDPEDPAAFRAADGTFDRDAFARHFEDEIRTEIQERLFDDAEDELVRNGEYDEEAVQAALREGDLLESVLDRIHEWEAEWGDEEFKGARIIEDGHYLLLFKANTWHSVVDAHGFERDVPAEFDLTLYFNGAEVANVFGWTAEEGVEGEAYRNIVDAARRHALGLGTSWRSIKHANELGPDDRWAAQRGIGYVVGPGRRSVADGLVKGALGVRRIDAWRKPKGWQVVHLPSGFDIGKPLPDLASAKFLADSLRPLTNWAALNADLMVGWLETNGRELERLYQAAITENRRARMSAARSDTGRRRAAGRRTVAASDPFGGAASFSAGRLTPEDYQAYLDAGGAAVTFEAAVADPGVLGEIDDTLGRASVHHTRISAGDPPLGHSPTFRRSQTLSFDVLPDDEADSIVDAVREYLQQYRGEFSDLEEQARDEIRAERLGELPMTCPPSRSELDRMIAEAYEPAYLTLEREFAEAVGRHLGTRGGDAYRLAETAYIEEKLQSTAREFALDEAAATGLYDEDTFLEQYGDEIDDRARELINDDVRPRLAGAMLWFDDSGDGYTLVEAQKEGTFILFGDGDMALSMEEDVATAVAAARMIARGGRDPKALLHGAPEEAYRNRPGEPGRSERRTSIRLDGYPPMAGVVRGGIAVCRIPDAEDNAGAGPRQPGWIIGHLPSGRVMSERPLGDRATALNAMWNLAGYERNLTLSPAERLAPPESLFDHARSSIEGLYANHLELRRLEGVARKQQILRRQAAEEAVADPFGSAVSFKADDSLDPGRAAVRRALEVELRPSRDNLLDGVEPGSRREAAVLEWIKRSPSAVTMAWPETLQLDPRKLLGLPGHYGEHERVTFDDPRVCELADVLRAEGFDPKQPVVIWTEADGSTTIADGNHRIRGAVLAELARVPIDWRVFGAGDQHIGAAHPADYLHDDDIAQFAQFQERFSAARDRFLGLTLPLFIDGCDCTLHWNSEHFPEAFVVESVNGEAPPYLPIGALIIPHVSVAAAMRATPRNDLRALAALAEEALQLERYHRAEHAYRQGFRDADIYIDQAQAGAKGRLPPAARALWAKRQRDFAGASMQRAVRAAGVQGMIQRRLRALGWSDDQLGALAQAFLPERQSVRPQRSRLPDLGQGSLFSADTAATMAEVLNVRRYSTGHRLEDPVKQLVRDIPRVDDSKSSDEIFRDFCEMAACALASRTVPSGSAEAEKIEAQYMAVIERYGGPPPDAVHALPPADPDYLQALRRTNPTWRQAVAARDQALAAMGSDPEAAGEAAAWYVISVEKQPATRMARVLSTVMQAYAENPGQDLLGQVYMNLDLGQRQRGQFFTPWDVARFMADLHVDELAAANSVQTVWEPASGSGGIVLALAQAIRARGQDPGDVMRVYMVDLDRSCANMAYIQATLAGIPAIVVHGNSLTEEVFEARVTPALLHQAQRMEQALPSVDLMAARVLDILNSHQSAWDDERGNDMQALFSAGLGPKENEMAESVYYQIVDGEPVRLPDLGSVRFTDAKPQSLAGVRQTHGPVFAVSIPGKDEPAPATIEALATEAGYVVDQLAARRQFAVVDGVRVFTVTPETVHNAIVSVFLEHPVLPESDDAADLTAAVRHFIDRAGNRVNNALASTHETRLARLDAVKIDGASLVELLERRKLTVPDILRDVAEGNGPDRRDDFGEEIEIVEPTETAAYRHVAGEAFDALEPFASFAETLPDTVADWTPIGDLEHNGWSPKQSQIQLGDLRRAADIHALITELRSPHLDALQDVLAPFADVVAGLDETAPDGPELTSAHSNGWSPFDLTVGHCRSAARVLEDLTVRQMVSGMESDLLGPNLQTMPRGQYLTEDIYARDRRRDWTIGTAAAAAGVTMGAAATHVAHTLSQAAPKMMDVAWKVDEAAVPARSSRLADPVARALEASYLTAAADQERTWQTLTEQRDSLVETLAAAGVPDVTARKWMSKVEGRPRVDTPDAKKALAYLVEKTNAETLANWMQAARGFGDASDAAFLAASDLADHAGIEARMDAEALTSMGHLKRDLIATAARINPTLDIKFVRELYGEGQAMVASGAVDAERRQAAGMYQPAFHLATVSLNPRFDAQDTTYHEGFHSLERVLTAKERQVLADAFPPEGGMTTSERTAITFAAWATTRDRAGDAEASKVLRRLSAASSAFGGVFRTHGIDKAEKVFEKAYSGELGRRSLAAARASVRRNPAMARAGVVPLSAYKADGNDRDLVTAVFGVGVGRKRAEIKADYSSFTEALAAADRHLMGNTSADVRLSRMSPSEREPRFTISAEELLDGSLALKAAVFDRLSAAAGISPPAEFVADGRTGVLGAAWKAEHPETVQGIRAALREAGYTSVVEDGRASIRAPLERIAARTPISRLESAGVTAMEGAALTGAALLGAGATMASASAPVFSAGHTASREDVPPLRVDPADRPAAQRRVADMSVDDLAARREAGHRALDQARTPVEALELRTGLNLVESRMRQMGQIKPEHSQPGRDGQRAAGRKAGGLDR